MSLTNDDKRNHAPFEFKSSSTGLVVLVFPPVCSRLSARWKASFWNTTAVLFCFWTLNPWRRFFSHRIFVLVFPLICSRLSARWKASFWNTTAVLFCFWTLNPWRRFFSHRIFGLCVFSRALTSLLVHGSLVLLLLKSNSFVAVKEKEMNVM